MTWLALISSALGIVALLLKRWFAKKDDALRRAYEAGKETQKRTQADRENIRDKKLDALARDDDNLSRDLRILDELRQKHDPFRKRPPH